MRNHIYAVLFFLTLSFLLTYPVLLEPTQMLIGDPLSDIWAHLWGNWRTEREVLQNFRIPYEESYINYPFGGTLYHVDLLNSLVSIPLRYLFGAILSQNIVIWSQLTLGAYATFLLGQRLNFSLFTSYIIGLNYAFCPFILTLGLASGVTERLNIMWIPLYVICFLNIMEEKKWLWVVGACLCYAFATLGCWHYGLFIFLWTIPWSFAAVFSTNLSEFKRKLYHIALMRLLPLAILCAFFSFPLSFKASESVASDSSIVTKEFSIFWDGISRIDMTNLSASTDFIFPYTSGLWITKRYDLLYQSMYVGIFAIFFAGLSVVQRKRYALMFLCSALFFFVMSLGPEIRLYTDAPLFSSRLFYTIALYVPFIEAMQVPFEYCFMGTFCLSVAVGFGIEYSIQICSSQWVKLIKMEIFGIFVLSLFWIAPVVAPIPSSKVHIPSFYQEISQQSGGAVFDVPLRRAYEDLFPAEYFFYQTIHKRPIPHAIDHSWLDEDPFWIYLLEHQQSTSTTLLTNVFEGCWEGMPGGCHVLWKTQNTLKKRGYEYVVLHKNLIPKERLKDTVDLFDRIFQQAKLREKQNLRIYQIAQFEK
jgi:hypothetical protein